MARAVAKTEEESARALMEQIRERYCPDHPPAMATDGKGAYREAMVRVWGQVPAYSGRGRPPERKQPGTDWQYVQVIKQRQGYRVVGVEARLIYGKPETTLEQVGAHTAYVERTNLTTRQMSGRLVRKTLSYSKQVRCLRDASAWEDGVYNLTRPLKTLRRLRQESLQPARRSGSSRSGSSRWFRCSPAMAAGLTDHVWTIRELLTTVPVPQQL